MALAFVARAADPMIASFRYRVLAPIEGLRSLGHSAELFAEANAGNYDTVLFSKAYRPDHLSLARRLKANGARVLLDLCDNMFFNPRELEAYREVRSNIMAMLAVVDGVVCSTPVLAGQIQSEAELVYTPPVAPDPYDAVATAPRAPRPLEQPATLLWFGSSGSPNAEAGMSDLIRLAPTLVKAHARRAFELVVCSDDKGRFRSLFSDFPVPVRYRPWTPENFAAVLADCDGVVIPLSDNPFVAAKTHNRLSLALGLGLPVVADSIDSYRPFAPFCWLDAWDEGLTQALLDPQAARARAAAAKPYLEHHWSVAAVAPLWADALGLAPAAGPQT